MSYDVINDFIINGSINGINLKSSYTRTSIINKLGSVEGINKKNRTYEILKKNNILFYVGYGSIGFLQGIRIFNLLPMKIEYEYVKNVLKDNFTILTYDNSIIIITINGVKIYFDPIYKYVTDLIISKDESIEKKLFLLLS